MLINTTLVETFKNKTMDGLNNYTYRECCNQEIRECDDCTCYTCTRCGDYNFVEEHPLDEDVCFKCYTEELDLRQSEL